MGMFKVQTLLNPLYFIVFSCMFFWFIIKKQKPTRTILYLKCYCIFIMPFAIEALVRCIVYIHDIWGNIDWHLILFLIESIFVLCFCIFALIKKYLNFITHKIYIFFTLLLVALIIILPYVSLIFEASCQISSAWGCIAIALYGLSRYAVPREKIRSEEEQISETHQIFKIISCLCIILSIWTLFLWTQDTNSSPQKHLSAYYESAVGKYKRLHTKDFEKSLALSLSETLDMTNKLYLYYSKYLDPKYIRTGAILIVLKNKTFYIQYNNEAWTYCNRGVPYIGNGSYSASDSTTYDGTGNVYFWRIAGPFEEKQ